MRTFYKGLLGVLTAFAMLAVGASGAAAAVHITNESENSPRGTTCGAVSLDGHNVVQSGENCEIHAVNVAQTSIDLEVFGITNSRCTNEFTAAVQENGSGYIYNQVLGDVGTEDTCTVSPCAESGEPAPNPWPISMVEGDPDNNYVLTATFCVTGVECTVMIPVVVAGHSMATFGRTEAQGDEYTCENLPFVQVHGQWVTEEEGHDSVEIRHAP